MFYNLKGYWFLFLLSFSIALHGQYIKYHMLYKPKTISINTDFDSTLSFKTIKILSPFVDYRIYVKYILDDNLHDSAFACKLIDVDTTYISIPKDEFKNDKLVKFVFKKSKILSDFFGFKLTKKLNKFHRVDRTILGTQDSTTILNYIKALEKMYLDTKNKKQSIPDSIYKILQKTKTDHIVIPYLKYYQLNGMAPKTTNTWYLIHFFVFDLKNKHILFYKNYFDYLGIRYDSLTSYGIPKKTSYLIRPYKKFIKQNKKYLQKTKKDKNAYEQ